MKDSYLAVVDVPRERHLMTPMQELILLAPELVSLEDFASLAAILGYVAQAALLLPFALPRQFGRSKAIGLSLLQARWNKCRK